MKNATTKRQLKWQAMKPFHIGIVATMSAGKSTLVNALIGQELLHAANEATTAKITTIIHHNTIREIRGSVKFRNGKIARYYALNGQTLQQWNACTNIKTIHVHLKLNNIRAKKRYPILFDTPGPNNSQDHIHANLTYQFLGNRPLDLILYVLNATQIGIDDDARFLEKIHKQLQIRPYPIIFILNKIDVLDAEKGETLEHTLQNCRHYLQRLGFQDPVIFPVSAEEALLARKWAANVSLRRRERHQIKHYLSMLESDLPDEWFDISANAYIEKMLYHSGILSLERFLTTLLQK